MEPLLRLTEGLKYKMNIPNIIVRNESANIVLTSISEDMIDDIAAYTQSVENAGPFFNLSFRSRDYWLTMLKGGGIWSKEKGYLAIHFNSELCGVIWHFSHGLENSLEVGINIFNPASRGKGVGKNTVMLYVNLLFTNLPINRIQYNMASHNLASEKLALRCGFAYEGLHREAIFVRGSWMDLKLYSIMRREFSEGN